MKANNTRAIVMIPIVGMFFLFFGGIFLGEMILEKVPFPTSAYVINRKLLDTGESFDGHSTRITLTILEILDSSGKTISSGLSRVAICPSDSVVMLLWMGNGHISTFEATDPQSGQPVFEIFPTTYGSEVVHEAKLTVHIPKDAKPHNNLVIPWQAKMFILKYMKTEKIERVNKEFFDPVKLLQMSHSSTFSLTTPEERTAWSQRVYLALSLRFATYVLFASAMCGILIFLKRSLLAVVSTILLFAGVSIPWVFSLSNHLQWFLFLFLFWVAILVVALGVGTTAIKILIRYHPDVINELRGVGRLKK